MAGLTNHSKRIAMVDVARGLALLAMAIYHFTWDLEFFGYAAPGLTTQGGWRLFARLIAGSFLFLVGFSLVLAHSQGIRWRSFMKRLAQIAVAALAITVVTVFATPDRYIFFGILHCIAASSIIGLLFLRFPPAVTALVGAIVIVGAPYLASPLFDHPALLWLGLSVAPVRSNDFVPLFPWIGPVLLGMAAAQFMMRRRLLEPLAAFYHGDGAVGSSLMFAGRHSLVVYLLHQPVLVAAIYVFSLVAPPGQIDPVDVLRNCTLTCQETSDTEFCQRFCSCAVDRLIEENLLQAALTASPEAQSTPEVRRVIQSCQADALMQPLNE